MIREYVYAAVVSESIRKRTGVAVVQIEDVISASGV